MTIADDMRTIAETELRLGTGPDGLAWAWYPVTSTPYAFADPGDVQALAELLCGLYGLAHSKVAKEDHARDALKVLRVIAQKGALLPEITPAMAPPPAPPPPPPPTGWICLNDGEVEVVGEVLRRLAGRDDVFLSEVTLTRAVRGDDGRIRLLPITDAGGFVAWCKTAGVRFYRQARGRAVEAFLDPGMASLVVKWREHPGVRPIAGISRVPVVRPDGSLATTDGYDEATGLFLDLDADVRALAIPEAPTAEDVALATKVILDVFAGFRWEDRASLANAVGLTLTTAALKPMHPAMLVPIHAVNAAMQGSGKTLVAAELPGVLAGGWSLLSYSEDEAETRKRITTELVGSSDRVLCFDNVRPGDLFESSVIAAVVTSTRWSDRLLGGNSKASRPQDRVWTVTGNNLRLGRDMLARTVPIMLDPGTDRPTERPFEVRLDDAETLRRMRPELLTAVLTVVRAWVLAGAPEAEAAPLRQFTTWARLCGGLLAFMGVEGHLGNPGALLEEDDDEGALALLLHRLRERHGADSFSTRDAVALLAEHPEWDETLPSWIEEKIQRDYAMAASGGVRELPKFRAESEAKLRRSVGNTFKNRRKQAAGGLAVVRAGEDRNGFGRWRVRDYTEVRADSADSADDAAPTNLAELENTNAHRTVVFRDSARKAGVERSAESAESAPAPHHYEVRKPQRTGGTA